MGQALYRKYRSKKLDEIVGQKSVTTALKNALATGNISHAYLFTGPRGVGKTSIARILAHEINKLSYESDELPIDIIEIDAASNRRIEEIRDLREKVRIAPVSAKYKVYIIDEVHMLTRDSFNALLKTLEEPPAHVIFILATTEAHKLPETIVSRTQRYTFKLASEAEVAQHLKSIAKKESIQIDDSALNLLARHSGGSLRDALSLLDQVRHGATTIDSEIVRNSLGLPSDDIIDNLLEAIQSNEPQSVMQALAQSRDDGASATLIAEQLLSTIRSNLIKKTGTLCTEDNIKLAQSLLLVESSSRPEVQLELALIGAQMSRQGNVRTINSPATIVTNQPPLTISEPAKRPVRKQTMKSTPQETAAPKPAEPAIEPTAHKTVSHESSQDLNPDTWAEALTSIRQSHNTIYSILRMSQPDFKNINEKQLTLLFKFPFHQKRMNESRNKQIIVDILTAMGIHGYEINCDILPKNHTTEPVVKAVVQTVQETPPETSNALLGQIRNVFGGAEVLE